MAVTAAGDGFGCDATCVASVAKRSALFFDPAEEPKKYPRICPMPAVSVPRRIRRTGLSLIVSEFTSTMARTTKNATVKTVARIDEPHDSGELMAARSSCACRARWVSSAWV